MMNNAPIEFKLAVAAIVLIITIRTIYRIVRYVKWKRDRSFMKTFFKNNYDNDINFNNSSDFMNSEIERMNMDNARDFADFSINSVTPSEFGGLDHSNDFNNFNQF